MRRVVPAPTCIARLIRASICCLCLGLSPNARADFAKGADVSWLSEMEANGYTFKDRDGVSLDLLTILQSYSINSIRLRVWVDPVGGWCGKTDVVKQAVRAKNRGMRIMIDFHYSDTWADPAHQAKPAAWANHSFSQLLTDVYDHTFDVLSALKAAGVSPEWVQVGNEIRAGMLWPDGDTNHFSQLAQLINRGYDAVKAVSPSTKVVIHCHNGFETDAFQQFFDQLEANHGQYDVIGLSHYPTASNWQLRNVMVQTTLNTMASRYGKEVAICETGMPMNAPQVAKDMLVDLIAKTQAVPGGRGLGVFYWEPEAYNWRNYGLGAWGTDGRPTAAMEAFGNPDQPPANPSPSITTDPVSQTLSPGSTVTFSVVATGPNLTYSWQKNGTVLSGQTSSVLSISNLQPSDNGSYTAIVSNPSGQVTSAAAVLLVDTPKPGRLINLSVRSRAGMGSDTLIAGFIISGAGQKPVVIRGTGQTLTHFGLSGVLADPLLDLFRGSTLQSENDSWATAPNLAEIIAGNWNILGSFTLDPKDAVIATALLADNYTAQVKGADGGSGVALVEVFDNDTAQPGTPEFDAQPRLANLSARSQVGTGENVLIAGFVINGNVPKRVMLRASGPTLAGFGVSGVLPDPLLQLNSGGTVIAQNDNWDTAPNLSEIIALNGHKLGDFTFDHHDAILLVTLPPGSYTALVRGVNNVTGVALIEVFDVQ